MNNYFPRKRSLSVIKMQIVYSKTGFRASTYVNMNVIVNFWTLLDWLRRLVGRTPVLSFYGDVVQPSWQFQSASVILLHICLYFPSNPLHWSTRCTDPLCRESWAKLSIYRPVSSLLSPVVTSFLWWSKEHDGDTSGAEKGDLVGNYLF